ncbi:MAG: lysophospholipid acyltransferase family protein [Patescibacteria group bacterium]
MGSRSVSDKIHDFLYWCIRKSVGFVVKAIWIKKVVGIDNIPKAGPVIVAFNHQSYFDFLCFVSVSNRNVHFLSAEKFFDHLFWSPIMKITRQIRVDRKVHDKRVLHNRIFEHLREAKMIGIFPEGTRSPDKENMLPAFTGVARYAVRGHVPVVPIGIRGAHEVMSRKDTFPKFCKTVEMHVGKPISFENYSHTKLGRRAFRVLTNQIMLEIAELSTKKYRHLQHND